MGTNQIIFASSRVQIGLVPRRINNDSIHAGMTTVITVSHVRYVMLEVKRFPTRQTFRVNLKLPKWWIG